jgi:hypothetical protein
MRHWAKFRKCRRAPAPPNVIPEIPNSAREEGTSWVETRILDFARRELSLLRDYRPYGIEDRGAYSV